MIEWAVNFPVLPLAVIENPGVVRALGDGLVAGGLPVVEVALRGDFGWDALHALSARGDLLVGAGTVLDENAAHRAIELGARFLISPGLSTDVLRVAGEADIPYTPGVLTPTEVQTAACLGLTHLKLFPAGSFGGPGLVATYAQVFRDMRFMPSGGVGPGDVREYMSLPSVFAVSGSWIAARAGQGSAAVAEAARAATGDGRRA